MPSFEADCSVSSRNLKSDRGFSYVTPHHSMMLTQLASPSTLLLKTYCAKLITPHPRRVR